LDSRKGYDDLYHEKGMLKAREAGAGGEQIRWVPFFPTHGNASDTPRLFSNKRAAGGQISLYLKKVNVHGPYYQGKKLSCLIRLKQTFANIFLPCLFQSRSVMSG